MFLARYLSFFKKNDVHSYFIFKIELKKIFKIFIMKQFLIISLAIFGFSVTTNAQVNAGLDGQGLDRDAIERRLERNDSRIEHDRHSENPKTWVDRGIIFQDMFDINTEFIYFGMAQEELVLFMGEPNEIRTEETDFSVRTILVYDNIEVFFEEGALVSYMELDVMHEDPLNEAYNAFQTAIKLQEEEELSFFQRIFRSNQERRLQNAFDRLYGQFINDAVVKYERDDFSQAYNSFSKAIDVADSPFYLEPLDENIVFNTGFVATLAGNVEEALKYYNRAREMDYDDVSLYILISDSYLQLGDSLRAENVLQEGFEKFPAENSILVELVNFYLESGKSEDALEYLQLAKEQEPDNPTFHYAEGTLYERLNEPQKAVEAYKAAIEIEPDFFEANFNLGVYYYNQAVNLLQEAQDITDNVEYEKARDAAYDEMAYALPYLERAHKSQPDNIDTMETLRIIYYRLDREEELREMYEKLGREFEE